MVIFAISTYCWGSYPLYAGVQWSCWKFRSKIHHCHSKSETCCYVHGSKTHLSMLKYRNRWPTQNQDTFQIYELHAGQYHVLTVAQPESFSTVVSYSAAAELDWCPSELNGCEYWYFKSLTCFCSEALDSCWSLCSSLSCPLEGIINKEVIELCIAELCNLV